MSQATGLSSVLQQLSVALGVSVAAGALEWTRALRGDTHLVAADFTAAFLLVAGISLLSVFSFLRLPADAGQEVSGHRTAPAE